MTESSTVDFVVPYDETNAAVRTRIVAWVDRVLPSFLDSQLRVIGPAKRRDALRTDGTVVVFRNRSRLSRGRREAEVLSSSAFGIYELDDGLPWDDGRLPELGRWWKRPFPRSRIARRAASAADRVIAGNEVLADWASGHCDDVVVIPTCVEPSDYRQHDVESARELRSGPFTVGWIGSPATQHFLHDLIDPLTEFARSAPVRVELIGAAEHRLPAQLRRMSTVVPWSEAVAHERLATWSVGVMPLHDGVYERAKCGYKLLQYAAAGLPAVGSPIGVNQQLLQQMDGFAPSTDTEWLDALREVAGAPADRRILRQRRSLRTAHEFSYGAWEPTWRRAVGLPLAPTGEAA